MYKMEHECTCQLVEVARRENMVLYEDNSGLENDGCSIAMLKEFFPEYSYEFNKMYFIEIDGQFYHGDTLEDYIFNNVATEE